MTSATSELRLGARTVPGWYWLLSGRQRVPYLPREDAAIGNLDHCFSYEKSRTVIKDAALELIEDATDKIFLASFRFVDDDLRAALRQAAARLCGGVYVITSIDKQKDLRQTIDFTASYEDDEEEDWFDEADPTLTPHDVNDRENKKHYSDLCAGGVWVRGHSNFHAKFLVVDDRKALISSANLESAALADAIDRPGRRPGHDAVTGESGVVTTRRADAKLLGRFFARLWYAECEWDAPPGRYQLSHRKAAPIWFEVGRTPPGKPGPIWTGGGDQLILDAIHQVCALAQKDLILATFSTKGLENHPDLLSDPVRAAIDRGVRVRLLLRSRNFQEARKTAGMLASWGVEVYGDDKTHAKCAIADGGKHGAIFSANFDAEHGIYSGTEVGMRLDGEEVLADVAHFFEHCITCAPQRLAENPTAAECVQLAARTLHEWPLPSEIRVSCPEQVWAAFAATRGPVLYTSRDDRDLTLHADGGKWQLTRSASGRWRMALIEPADRGSRPKTPVLLDSWLAPGRSARDDPYRSRRRGLCLATLLRA
jgi:cardiolipin synthase A/B